MLIFLLSITTYAYRYFNNTGYADGSDDLVLAYINTIAKLDNLGNIVSSKSISYIGFSSRIMDIDVFNNYVAVSVVLRSISNPSLTVSLVALLDNNLNLLWARRINLSEDVGPVEMNGQGVFVGIGRYILKFDFSGNLIFSRALSSSLAEVIDISSVGNDILILARNNLIRMNGSTGNVVFRTSYSFSTTTWDLYLRKVNVVSGGYALVGNAIDNNLNLYDVILKVDNQGNLLWHKILFSSVSSSFWDVVGLSDGSIVAVGDRKVARFSSSGSIVFYKIYPYNFGRFVNTTSDGGLIMSSAEYVLKTDIQGDVLSCPPVSENPTNIVLSINQNLGYTLSSVSVSVQSLAVSLSNTSVSRTQVCQLTPVGVDEEVSTKACTSNLGRTYMLNGRFGKAKLYIPEFGRRACMDALR